MTLGRDQSRIGADARADRPHNLLPNCLDRCSFCPLLVVMDPWCCLTSRWRNRFILDPIRWSLHETKNDGSTGSGRERHGLFRDGAFQAARIRRPSIQYSRVVLPPGPNSWPLNIPAGWSVPARTAGFCWPYRIVQECGALATYRPVSCVSNSTICRCITGRRRSAPMIRKL
jgi:hypothetical protein